jgi:hypothetical protein
VGAAGLYNLGSCGAAFGVADNTTATVMDPLLSADSQAVNGVLSYGDRTRRLLAAVASAAINEAGGI